MNPLHPWHTTIHGVPAGFEQPLWLAAALLLAVATAHLVRSALRRVMARGWVAPRLASELVPGRAPGREALKVALLGTGLTLLAVACAGPFWGELRSTAHRRGVDVVVALDASRSMLGHDVQPDRLTQARVAVESLIDQLHGDRIGLVTFAKDAFAQAPLTTDYDAARLYLRAVNPLQMQQGGTDVGGALRTAGELLQRAKKGPRQQVVVLLTDGEDWGQDAATEAKNLAGRGVLLDTVAVGTEAGAPVPDLDARGREVGMLRDSTGAPVMTHANRVALAALAQAGGGQSFDLAADPTVRGLAEAIDHLHKDEIEEVTVSSSAKRFAAFAVPALAFFLMGLALSPSRRRRLAIPAAVAVALAIAAPSSARADPLHVPEHEASAGAQAYQAGHFDEALRHFQADTSHPAEARFNRGDALAGLGRSSEAIEAFKTETPTLRGRDAYNRGTLEAQQKHQDEAIGSLRQALVADPSNEDARHNLEVLLAAAPPPKKQDSKPKNQDSKSSGNKQEPKPGSKDGQANAKDSGSKPGDSKKQDGAPKDQGKQPQETASNGPPKPGSQGQSQPPSQAAPSADGSTPKPGEQPNPGSGARADGREPSPSERMLDALKAGDRLLPYRPASPERSTPDAHPW